jgi:hypothetical protein
MYEYYIVAVFSRLRTYGDHVKIVSSFLLIINLFIDIYHYIKTYDLYISIYFLYISLIGCQGRQLKHEKVIVQRRKGALLL